MKLAVLAENIMNLYFQDFPSDEEFLDRADFQSQVVSAYAKLLVDDYGTQKLINKQTEGYSMVSLSADLLQQVEIELKQEGDVYIATLPKPYFVFPFDTMATAIQSVTPVGKRCKEFIKVAIDDRWKICQIPEGANSYYTAELNKIVFERLACKGIEKVSVVYAPQFNSMDDEFPIPDTRTFQIQTMVLQVMFAAKDGRVIDMANDSNMNTTLPTEINSDLTKK